MKNVLIDGATSPLGARLAETLSHRPDIRRLVGVEPEMSSSWSPYVELIDFEPDHRMQFQMLQDFGIDTVIQCGLAPDRTGDRTSAIAASVIETMRLGAAIGHAGSPVRCWVVLSSSSVYPVDSKRPLLNTEDSATVAEDDLINASLVEAEEYAADVARRSPHLNVAILRLQEIIGKGVSGPLASHFDQRVVPTVLGHDPLLQFLHIEDAIDAVECAADLELAGIYNVASNGVIRLGDFVSCLEKQTIPFLPIETGVLSSLSATLGLPSLPDGLLPRLRFGHAIDTHKIEAAGFKPKADQLDCAAALKG